jgi:AcrR family transcriptional regulator
MAATEEDRETLPAQAAAIRDMARRLLEDEGPQGLSMRRLADRLGLHPPALYRHFLDKRAVEDAIIVQAFWECGDAMLEGGAAAGPTGYDRLDGICQAYRAWGVGHPHVYRLIFGRPLTPGIDPKAERHLGRATRELVDGDLNLARAIWGAAHGLILLELDGRLPPDADVEGIWRFTLSALHREIEQR